MTGLTCEALVDEPCPRVEITISGLGVLPLLALVEAELLGLADFLLPVITAVIIGAWYALWRWLEPHLPDWLTRAVLGSAKTPSYQGKHKA